jgi:diguanylate cyclase (GGDEF)-like protein
MSEPDTSHSKRDSVTTDYTAENLFRIKRLIQIFWAAEACLLVALLYRTFIAPEIKMAVTYLVCGICIGFVFILIRKRNFDLATTILMTIFTVATFAIMYRSDGVRDESVLALPGILMFAAMLGSPRLFFALLSVMVVGILSMGYATQLGLLATQPMTNDFNSAALVIIVLSLVGFSVWLMSTDIRRVLKRLSRENQRVRESQAEIQKLVHHDALTGLPNRILARDRFQQALAKTSRGDSFVCMMFVDLDDFKSVNDSLGHQVGDKLLVEVAERLTRVLRSADTVARLGGDEFILLLESIDNKEQITTIASKINEAIARPYNIHDREIICTCSIGIAIAPADGQDFDTLLKNTDMAMYSSKELGRNHFRFFDDEMNTNAQKHMVLIADLRKAVSEQSLELYYQPKIDLQTGRVIGAEALMRWEHPEQGMIPPNIFIPLAEASGLIIEMGAWAVHKACEDCHQWNTMGFPDITVAVNTSPLQFKRGDIGQIVQQALLETRLTPWNLELEMTESLLIDDFELLKQTLANLKRIGVSFSIDDFGTGYSNLGYLKQFDVNSLKIDQSFVQRIKEDEQDVAIVGAIIQMASNLSLKTIAEGIEDHETAEFLRNMGCNQAQGFLWSKPVIESEFRRFLLKEKVFDVKSANN